MSRRTRWLVGLALALLLLTPVLAQGRLVLVDPAGRLNESAVQAAAGPLIRRGAQVAVYVVDNGGEADFNRRLIADGLGRSDGSVRSNLIAIYVAVNDRYSAIVFGDDWNAALAVNDNYETIRSTQLNPGLAAGDFTRGVTSALTAIETAIVNPPRPGGGLTINTDLTPVVIGGLGLAGAAAAGAGAYQLRRRRQTRQAAEKRLRDAREQAGGWVVQLGQRFADAAEKAKYDRVSYPPAAVAELLQMQEAARNAFTALKVTFDEIGEQLNREAKPSLEALAAAATAYEQLQEKAATVAERLHALEQRRAELDALARQAQEDVDQAKKVLTGVAERLPQFGNELADHAGVLAPAQRELERAVAVLAQLEAAVASTAARAASVIGQTLINILDRYAKARAAIAQGRRTAEALAAEGYRMDACHAALDAARAALDRLAAALQQGDLETAEAAIMEAEAALERARQEGFDLPAIRAENERRIAALAERGPQIADLIAQGREAFDLVDEFAESTWADICGNGSEAEAAAERAFEHWEAAKAANTMETQEFLAARSYLDAAEQELDHVERLIGAITDRLRALEHARAIARDLLAEADRSINAGRSFVAAHDADVSPQADTLLARAATLLQAAQAEAAKPNPDWLRLVQDAQEADRLADQALAGARDEAEQTARLRERAQQAQQLATAEVQKLVHYASVHDADLAPATIQQIEQVRQQVQQTFALMRQAEEREDAARRQVLTETIERYQVILQMAMAAYQAAYADVQRLEALRAQLNQALQQARDRLDRIERLRTASLLGWPASVSGKYTALQQRFNHIRLPINGEQALNAALAEAKAIITAADELLLTLQPSLSSRTATDSVASTIGRAAGGWGYSRSWSSSSRRSSWGSSSSSSSGWSSRGGGGGSFGRGGGGGSFGRRGGGGGW
ncbi:TPM domain-containing protein [uncultured Chloroflexus sp.]|uniref:TPM domain-containing protein n=1 Tax=uncultured Chloroflexus sp. TaxID=214040 RepID=UPI00261B3317|nr:TPM domain-containing protein [uncultured Chloroflexus sp.]